MSLLALGGAGTFACAGPDGAALFAEHCAVCHGAGGEGVPAQRELYPAVDLTASELVARRARTEIYRRIAWGYGAMPGFEHRLELAEIEALIDFVVTLDEPLARARHGRPTNATRG